MDSLKDKFLINPDIHFLNFGSYGACPKPVFENYQYWQRLLEFETVQFINVNGASNLANSRAAMTKYVDVPDKDDLVYITNPTLGVNMIAKNLNLAPNDEVLTTDLEYGACDRTWDLYCEKSKAIYKRQQITLPITTKEKFIEDFFAGLTDRTKVVFISHITSSTGLILPTKEIVEIAKSKGIITIVDGAHVPGQLPLSIKDLDADFYTGAAHKWMMAAKGCSFLYAHKRVQPLLKEPLIVSWGYKAIKPSGSNFIDYNQMIGTRDFSAFLTIPSCIQFMEENNWPLVAEQCHELVVKNADRFFDLLESSPISPLTKEWVGQMLSIPIKTDKPEQLQRKLFSDYNIEVPIMKQGDNIYLRYSINGFNSQQDLDALYAALVEIKKQGGFIL